MTLESFESNEAAVSTTKSKRHLWILGPVVIVVAGVIASGAAADALARSETATKRKNFDQASAQVAATLQLAIQHQDDLVVNAGAFVVTNPTATQTDFTAWAAAAQVLPRYPEVIGLGLVVVVPVAELPAFIAQLQADPVTANASFDLVPPGERPFYCLNKFGTGQTVPNAPPQSAGTDWCAGDVLRAASEGARDTGQGSYLPLTVGTNQLLAVDVPIYRAGVTPTTVDARRAAFLGWIGTVSSPQMLLAQALQDRPGMSVSLTYHLNSSEAEFTSGTKHVGGWTATTDLHNGWTVKTTVEAGASGIFSDANAVMAWAAGVAICLLGAALVFVLGGSRSRALRLVAERTIELRHQALHDALTGLPNRALIMDRIEQLLSRNRHLGTTGAALYIDLDDFKNVNDTLGHNQGDLLLKAVAARLTSALRDADTIGRMGGDEFVVLIDGAHLNVAPELVAERLLDVMRQPFELSAAAMPLTVSTSIGIAIGDRPSAGELLRDADVALYQAKAAGKNRYEVYFPEMHSAISRRLELEFDLRSAVEGKQFHLAYQPIYDLTDLSLIGVEALLRWEHPTLGSIVPDEFIPILEQSGQIQGVGRWVLQQACGQMAQWHARGDTLDLSVNVSGRQLDHDDIIDDVREALATSGLDATSLIIEVTESALMTNAAATARRLQVIKDLGVRIAVDDFGTGYSSLAYLRQFPVDCLKIDRAFTHAITTSPESKALIGTLVQLGKDLGLKTLAEGVETSEELDHLRREHVTEAQGFLLSRPLDPRVLETQLLEPTRAITGKGQRQRP